MISFGNIHFETEYSLTDSENNSHALSRLGMSVTTQGGFGRQFVTGPGRNIFKYGLVLLNVYHFQET